MSKISSAAKTFEHARAFAALGDGTRLRLVRQLSDRERRSVSDLSADAAMTRQAVSKHLRVLEEAGLVRSVRAGRERHFTLDPSGVVALRDYLDGVSHQWGRALDRLRDFVERDPSA